MDIIYRYEPRRSTKSRKYKTSEEAYKALRDGNRRLQMIVKQVRAEVVDGEKNPPIVIRSHPLSLGFSLKAAEAPAQTPFGIVLGCSDARSPIERVFDQSHNDLFVVRVAGNVLGTECLGSVQYAARHFAESLKLVVVLGHTECGAVKAAVDLYLDPGKYDAIAQTYPLRSIIDRILFAVRMADEALRRRRDPDASADPGDKAALGLVAVFLNAALTAHDLARELNLGEDDGLEVVYGVNDLVSQRVEAAPGHKATFAPAPKDHGEFSALADLVVDSILGAGTLAKTK